MRASLFLLRYLNPPKEFSFKVKKYLAILYTFLTGSMVIFNLLRSHKIFSIDFLISFFGETIKCCQAMNQTIYFNQKVETIYSKEYSNTVLPSAAI